MRVNKNRRTDHWRGRVRTRGLRCAREPDVPVRSRPLSSSPLFSRGDVFPEDTRLRLVADVFLRSGSSSALYSTSAFEISSQSLCDVRVSGHDPHLKDAKFESSRSISSHMSSHHSVMRSNRDWLSCISSLISVRDSICLAILRPRLPKAGCINLKSERKEKEEFGWLTDR